MNPHANPLYCPTLAPGGRVGHDIDKCIMAEKQIKLKSRRVKVTAGKSQAQMKPVEVYEVCRFEDINSFVDNSEPQSFQDTY